MGGCRRGLSKRSHTCVHLELWDSVGHVRVCTRVLGSGTSLTLYTSGTTVVGRERSCVCLGRRDDGDHVYVITCKTTVTGLFREKDLGSVVLQ